MVTQSIGVPDTWFVYDWPLTEVPNAPVPSIANYEPTNVAWLMEVIGSAIGVNPAQMVFRYENNTPNNPNDDIYVKYPSVPGWSYRAAWNERRVGTSPEQATYEYYAKSSPALKLFQDASPAKIRYFE